MGRTKGSANKSSFSPENAIVLSGFLSFSYSKSYKPILRQSNGLNIDIIGRLQEIEDSFEDRIGFEYYVSNTEKNEEEMLKGLLKTYYGALNLMNDDYVESGCETCGGSYESELKVGGHDLIRELKSHDGKYIFLKIFYRERYS